MIVKVQGQKEEISTDSHCNSVFLSFSIHKEKKEVLGDHNSNNETFPSFEENKGQKEEISTHSHCNQGYVSFSIQREKRQVLGDHSRNNQEIPTCSEQKSSKQEEDHVYLVSKKKNQKDQVFSNSQENQVWKGGKLPFSLNHQQEIYRRSIKVIF